MQSFIFQEVVRNVILYFGNLFLKAEGEELPPDMQQALWSDSERCDGRS